MGRLGHYDVFALVYDATTEPLHRVHRRSSVDLLHLRPGQTVIDVPCGTGANFALLAAAVGSTGRVVGLDRSPGMLKKARAKIHASGWEHVRVVEAEAGAVSRDLLGTARVDAVISMLGLSVIPAWQDAFAKTWDLLAPGGRYVAMDLYLDGRPSSDVANAFFRVAARADSRRRFWEPLEQLAPDFELHDDPCWGGVARIVAGTKPRA